MEGICGAHTESGACRRATTSATVPAAAPPCGSAAAAQAVKAPAAVAASAWRQPSTETIWQAAAPGPLGKGQLDVSGFGSQMLRKKRTKGKLQLC